MTWDADRPKGNQPFNVGDEAIAANFAWLEAAIGVDQTFPGTTTTRGRKKGATDTVTNADGLSGLEDGNEIHISDLGGGSQQDGDGASTHFWPHRYSAAGGGSQLSAWVPMTPPVCDDNTEQGTLEGKLGTDDVGLIAYRKVGDLYVPMLWDGSAFQLTGVTEIASESDLVDTDVDTASSFAAGSAGGPYSGWDQLESSGSGDEFHLTASLPDCTGLTIRLTLKWSLGLIGGARSVFSLGITEDIAAAGENDLCGQDYLLASGSDTQGFAGPLDGFYQKEFAGAAAQDYEYRIYAKRNAGAVVVTIAPDSGNTGLNADNFALFRARFEVVAIT